MINLDLKLCYFIPLLSSQLCRDLRECCASAFKNSITSESAREGLPVSQHTKLSLVQCLDDKRNPTNRAIGGINRRGHVNTDDLGSSHGPMFRYILNQVALRL